MGLCVHSVCLCVVSVLIACQRCPAGRYLRDWSSSCQVPWISAHVGLSHLLLSTASDYCQFSVSINKPLYFTRNWILSFLP